MKEYLKLIRVKHWLKNFLIFLPLFFSINLFNNNYYLNILLAFFIFSIASSIIYILNDINDIENELRTNNIKPIYSFVLKVENENVEIILERVMTEKDIKNVDNFECYYELDGLSLVDFDNDGKLEIVASGIVWDIPEIFVFKTNEASETELCLYGNFAW